MPKLSLVLDEEHVERVDDLVDDGVADSRSEAVRELIDRAGDVEDLRAEVERERARADDLQRQLRERGRREEDVEELVERVEEETDLLAEERERQREREAAGALTRARWWLFGRDLDEDDASGQ